VATLSVLKFNDPYQADQVLSTLQGLQKQQLIQIQDAAIVRWPAGAKKPKTEQLSSLTGVGALSGAFWGMLFGLLFFIPFLGMAIGAAFGALGGHFMDVGIDDSFINSVKSQVTPGTSALFLMSSGAVADRVADALKGVEFEVIATNLSEEQETKLKELFAEE
jgi:uncharacterized membrane protein